ncbi:DNA primase [Campylobacter pinnipediorum subsp. caledonicus]|uniref:DNA primase n=1 Tax=Campylobacter pinnipediorum TaxID=1965231 RepID=UPI0009955585|nr:DNA primase [Campylobacter pinnipediorum]AQW86861.1 DNA primase [Campylobacter pinnipediorum subsp. caledonicus]
MIEQKSIDRLLEQVDIVDVVSHYVDIQKSGANYKCVCPFHDDRNPSMSISPQRQIYHCFSCKAGGNAIKFIMDFEKLNYPEAIEKLASISNFTLEYTNNNSKPIQNKQILENVNAFYRSCLYKNQNALNYLYSRGLNDKIIEHFGLGYAPENSATLRLLENEKILPQEALEVGIIKQNEKGIYASFIERISFPIYNHTSRLVGFGGRTITNHMAKYVNSPQSVVFDKSKLLYGYNLAKQTIYQKKKVIITEGYLDVIMLHSAGFTNAVAVLGTALTEKHLPLLKRENISAILCFDGDEAGINAAIKSSLLLSTNEIDGSVVIIDDGADPADMVFANKIKELEELFESGIEIGEFYIRQIALKYDLERPVQKQKCLDEITQFTNKLKPVVSVSYNDLVSELIGVSINLAHNFKQENYKYKNQETTKNVNINNKISKDLLELSILKTMFSNENFKKFIISNVNSSYFFNHSDIFNAILNLEKVEENTSLRELWLDDSAIAIEDFDKLQIAINNLKIKYFENLQMNKRKSKDADKLEVLEKIAKIIKGLKEKNESIGII